jgi:hypothetical protein
MKTTIEIPNSLLEEARKLASQEGTTVRALVETGLRRVLTDRKKRGKFKLRNVSFKGDGLQPDVADASWVRIREMAYEGRGG